MSLIGLVGFKSIVYLRTAVNGGHGAPICTVDVDVYPLRVTLEAVKWRESAERDGVWFRTDEAAALMEEGGLGLIIEEWSP